MTVHAIRAKIRPEAAADVEAAATKVFAALDESRPDGLKYTAGRLADGVTYLILVQVDEGVANPLDALPEYREFVRGLRGWQDGRPEEGPMELVGSYRLF